MTAWFMVRAVVADATLRGRFDRWYEQDHLPEAAAAFGADRAWRCWSRTDPAVHVAFYEFSDLAAAENGTRADILKPLIDDFDATWPSGVTRTRDYLELAGEWTG